MKIIINEKEYETDRTVMQHRDLYSLHNPVSFGVNSKEYCIYIESTPADIEVPLHGLTEIKEGMRLNIFPRHQTGG